MGEMATETTTATITQKNKKKKIERFTQIDLNRHE